MSIPRGTLSDIPRTSSYLQGSLQWRIASAITVGTVGLLSKAFLYGFHSVQVNGLDDFLKLLENRKKPIITVSNHISVMDDPLLWGMLPVRTLYQPRNVRWALGSADICFTNRVISTFFGLGQTLPTYRHGRGMFQPAIADAIRLLSYSNVWLHIFPEGRIRQSNDNSMRYFKWGVSRIILDTSIISGTVPTIVPMFIEGFDQIMHETRSFPRFLPRLRKRVSCTYGEPIPEHVFTPFVDRWRSLIAEKAPDYETSDGLDEDRVPEILKTGEEAMQIRVELTAVIRQAVSDLRRKAGYPDEHPRSAEASWYTSDEGKKYDGDGYGGTVIEKLEPT